MVVWKINFHGNLHYWLVTNVYRQCNNKYQHEIVDVTIEEMAELAEKIFHMANEYHKTCIIT